MLPIVRRLAASLVTGVALALTAHLTSLVAFSIANSFAAESLGQMNGYFLPASLVAFAIFFLGALAGLFDRWYTALATGAVAGIVAPLVGSLVGAVAAGATLTADIVAPLIGTLLTVNLVFLVTSVVASVTLGRRVWRSLQNPAGVGTAGGRRLALVRPPSPNLADGLVTHIDRSPIDVDLADAQWDDYVAALAAEGFTAVEVDPAPDLADAVFIEDAVVVFGELAVVTNPGHESRRGETVAAEASVTELGLELARIQSPGTLDGGDVLTVGQTVYVGSGGRTNGDGIRQLRAILSGRGYTVVAVPVTRVLHLKSAVTALPDGTVIGYPPLVDDPAVFGRFLAVPEEGGAHVVVLAADAVLMAASAPLSAALLESLGYRVVVVDISEFEKLEGCVTCLSVRVR